MYRKGTKNILGRVGNSLGGARAWRELWLLILRNHLVYIDLEKSALVYVLEMPCSPYVILLV